MLSHYWWPGNIRELENLIERVVATCDGEWITDDDLPFDFHVAELDHQADDKSLLDRALATFERNLHHSRAREAGLERHADGSLSGRAVIDAQVQDRSIRNSRAAEASERRMIRVNLGAGAASRPEKETPQSASPFSNQGAGARYFRGRTASFNCLTMRALTTVLAGILMGSPVAGLRPMRAFRF